MTNIYSSVVQVFTIVANEISKTLAHRITRIVAPRQSGEAFPSTSQWRQAVNEPNGFDVGFLDYSVGPTGASDAVTNIYSSVVQVFTIVANQISRSIN